MNDVAYARSLVVSIAPPLARSSGFAGHLSLEDEAAQPVGYANGDRVDRVSLGIALIVFHSGPRHTCPTRDRVTRVSLAIVSIALRRPARFGP
ncbi:MAG: hypothetical protein JNK05_29040 [Myxococcales bacterium]|nr:hypothetical protein [Myxococcales bacterium]